MSRGFVSGISPFGWWPDLARGAWRAGENLGCDEIPSVSILNFGVRRGRWVGRSARSAAREGRRVVAFNALRGVYEVEVSDASEEVSEVGKGGWVMTACRL